MDNQSTDFSILDMLSEKNTKLRRKIVQLWYERNAGLNIDISPSEWFMLSRVQEEHMSISDVARAVGVTRQATHKSLMSMQEKGLVIIDCMPDNKRDKVVKATAFGVECHGEYIKIKKELESKIILSIGKENTDQLKKLLSLDWILY